MVPTLNSAVGMTCVSQYAKMLSCFVTKFLYYYNTSSSGAERNPIGKVMVYSAF